MMNSKCSSFRWRPLQYDWILRPLSKDTWLWASMQFGCARCLCGLCSTLNRVQRLYGQCSTLSRAWRISGLCSTLSRTWAQSRTEAPQVVRYSRAREWWLEYASSLGMLSSLRHQNFYSCALRHARIILFFRRVDLDIRMLDALNLMFKISFFEVLTR
jgi:hypothetical protein